MPTKVIKQGVLINSQLMMTHNPQARKITLIDMDNKSSFTLCNYEEAKAVANQLFKWIGNQKQSGD
jgi:hypothetical protein